MGAAPTSTQPAAVLPSAVVEPLLARLIPPLGDAPPLCGPGGCTPSAPPTSEDRPGR
jgi:hypothetical protein